MRQPFVLPQTPIFVRYNSPVTGKNICVLLLTLLSWTSYAQKPTPPKAVKKTKASWIGKWERDEEFNEASLEITDEAGGAITFQLSASSGGHMGYVEGTARIRGKQAFFKSENEDDTCRIKFTLKGDSIIEVDNSRGMCGAAIGVYYSGEYRNENKKSKQPDEMKLEGVVLDPFADSILKELAGKDLELFVNSNQLIDEETDLDSVGAKVQSAGVRGLYTLMENIVMYNKNEVWAAVIDDQKVNYYTNSPKYYSTLPKTIEAWRQRFKQYPVIYKSAK